MRVLSLSICSAILVTLAACANPPPPAASPSPHAVRSPRPVATRHPRAIALSTVDVTLQSGIIGTLQQTQDGRTVICLSGARWIVYDQTDPNACSTQSAGTDVRVLATGPDSQHMTMTHQRDPLIEVQATDGSWSGWTDATMIAPLLKPGVTLQLAGMSGQVTPVAIEATPDGKDEPTDGNVDVVVLRDGTSKDVGFTFVRVLEGKLRGETGWVLNSQLYDAHHHALGHFRRYDGAEIFSNVP
jgi:hypothetical protein